MWDGRCNFSTGVKVLPVDGSFQKKSEYQQQQEEQQQELLEDMAKEVVATQLTNWIIIITTIINIQITNMVMC